MKINFNIKLTKTQEKAYKLFHNEETKYLICNWSRQCGKSVFSEIILIENLLRKNKFSAYISPSFSQGRKVYNEIIKLINGKGIIKKANASTLTIETTIGSTLQFFSLESPTAIRGYTISGVLVLDEAAFFPDTLTDGSDPYSSIIMPITKARKPKVLVISTPKGKRGMFHDLYNKALKGENGFKYIKATIYDDELITEDEIQEIKSLVSPLSFREEFMTEFLDSSLTYFSHFEDCFSKYSYNETLPQWVGIDLSATEDGDNTVLTFINALNQTKSIIIEGTLTQKYNTIASLINRTRNIKKVLIEQNGVGMAMIPEIRKMVNNPQIIEEWTTTNQTKNEICSTLAIRITDKAISFDEEDKTLFSEFSTFISKYTKKGNLQLEAQSGHHDDKIMSMAIALHAKETYKQPPSPNFISGRKTYKMQ